MRKAGFLWLAAVLLWAAGCAAPRWTDEELSGVYVTGVMIDNNTGETGFLRPFLEIDGVAKRVTVEDSGGVWSSEWTREGNRLTLAAPVRFPAEIELGVSDDGVPMLKTRRGDWKRRVITGYRRVDSIGRKVGEPVETEREVIFDDPAALSEEDRRLLAETLLALAPWGDCRFRQVDFLDGGGEVTRRFDTAGSIRMTRRDPAILDWGIRFFTGEVKIRSSDSPGSVVVYLVR